MTDGAGPDFGDAVTAPYWQAARDHRLVIQRCSVCGEHQFYPRRFCLACGRDDALEWVDVRGTARVHSVVTVHMKVIPELEPPYQVAIVELAEGPRMTTNITGPLASIGDPVGLTWRDRPAPLPPVPIFELLDE